MTAVGTAPTTATAPVRVTRHHVVPRWSDEPGVRYAATHVGLALSALAAAAAGLPEGWAFGLLVVVGVRGSLRLPAVGRVGVALAAWAVWTGFFENALGQLTLATPDLFRLTVAVVACLVLRAPAWVRLVR